jgi:hypothetical protein
MLQFRAVRYFGPIFLGGISIDWPVRGAEMVGDFALGVAFQYFACEIAGQRRSRLRMGQFIDIQEKSAPMLGRLSRDKRPRQNTTFSHESLIRILRIDCGVIPCHLV